jgi:[ribosomal protein S18]-alanine N-acetyltransferase
MTGEGASVQIRRMRAGDIDDVMALAESLNHAPHWPRDVYEKALLSGATPERLALVALDSESRIAGFVVAAVIPPEAELETIVVAAESQRRGIAGLLFQELVAGLSDRPILEVMLEVRESNGPARAFYRSQGFVETGRRRAYYAAPREDALLLRRQVSSDLPDPREN